MTAMTVRMPDDKHQRLRALAESRGTTLNRLIDDMATVTLPTTATTTQRHSR
jgi:predicted transcriptional regulator